MTYITLSHQGLIQGGWIGWLATPLQQFFYVVYIVLEISTIINQPSPLHSGVATPEPTRAQAQAKLACALVN